MGSNSLGGVLQGQTKYWYLLGLGVVQAQAHLGACWGGWSLSGWNSKLLTAQYKLILENRVNVSTNIYGFSGLPCQDLLANKNKGFRDIYHHAKSLLVLAGSWHWVWDISRGGYFAQQQSKREHHWLQCIMYNPYMTGLVWYSEKNCPHLSQISWALIASAVFKPVQPASNSACWDNQFSRAVKSCMHVCNAVTMRCYPGQSMVSNW